MSPSKLQEQIAELEQENALLRAYIQHLETQAGYDRLTGLPNRYLLRDRLEQAVAQAARNTEPLAVLLLDVDHFMHFNVRLGHTGGDALLREIARRLQQCLRSADTIARLGSDEFVIVLQNTSQDQAQQVADKIVATLQSAFLLQDQACYVSVSIGISQFPRDSNQTETLLHYADSAMHQAKAQGSGYIRLYHSGAQSQTEHRLVLETELYQALKHDELRLYYQPQVRLRDSQLSGFEALLRWQHPRLGLVSPSVFIPLAEETGLIIRIGQWALETACAQLMAWRQQGLGLVRVAVNLSPRQFVHDQLIEQVRQTLVRYQVPAGALELEITESVLVQDIERAISIMHQLREAGVLLAIDDFGTGYSSLNYLKRFPIDALKIDRSFIREIVTDPTDATIASTITSMAHHLKKIVIAEGVETQTQRDFLHQRGCDLIQGYHLSRPLPAEQIPTWLEAYTEQLPLPASAQRVVLLVDDDAMMLELMELYLESGQYRVVTANSARMGLEILAGQAVDVLVTDYQMPDMDGAEFLRRVKTMHPGVLPIMISASTNVDALAKAVNEGALFRYLPKPVTQETLQNTVYEALEIRERSS